MKSNLTLYNSLARKKEVFVPLEEGFIGMYVCGPTVYSDVHLGNCRTFVSFDIIYRHLLYLGYKVRYVRNITDVGHLLDDGEDRIAKGARLNKLEPMEVVQKYTNGFHDMMRVFNTKNPSIEPRATAHIIEQIAMVQDIIDNGFGYERNGSVYFNTRKFADAHKSYGVLSGRVIDELLTETRDELKNQSEKDHPSDFAIWMKADENHLMKWPSPWSEGFPGWHLECSVMSTKYLGQSFDIHGGGNDLKFPHHENEIAQNVGACGCAPCKYWLHTNMLLMNGKKMSKSDGNTITPDQLFTGESDHISKGYSPMVVKFFMLMTHYRSTLDLTDGGLLAAEKGYKRLMEANKTLKGLIVNGSNPELEKTVVTLVDQVHEDMCDDFNTPKALSRLFEIVPIINSIQDKKEGFTEVSQSSIDKIREVFQAYIFDVFGLEDDSVQGGSNGVGQKLDGLMDLIIDIRKDARENKNWPVSDKIRDKLQEVEIQLKDGKEGTTWSMN